MLLHGDDEFRPIDSQPAPIGTASDALLVPRLAAFAALLGLFDAATLREAALTGLLAAADSCITGLLLAPVRFRFASFAAVFFVLA